MSDYTFEITPENVAIVSYRQEEVWRSRPTRLAVQAERLAKDWIAETSQTNHTQGITLVVQNLSIDPETLFGGKKHG